MSVSSYDVCIIQSNMKVTCTVTEARMKLWGRNLVNYRTIQITVRQLICNFSVQQIELNIKMI